MTDIHNINTARPPSVVAAALDCQGLSRASHWRATWRAIIRSSRLENPEDAAAFIGAYTNGRYTDFDTFVLRSTEREMTAFTRFVNNTLTAERAARTEPPPPRRQRPALAGRTYRDLFPDDEDAAVASSRPETLPGAQGAASRAIGASEDGPRASAPEWRPGEPLARPEESEEYTRSQLEVFYTAWAGRLRELDVMQKPALSRSMNNSQLRRTLFEIVAQVDELEAFFATFADEPGAE